MSTLPKIGEPVRLTKTFPLGAPLTTYPRQAITDLPASTELLFMGEVKGSWHVLAPKVPVISMGPTAFRGAQLLIPIEYFKAG